MDYLGSNIPKLGFGLMRLPMLGEEIDLEQVKQMVDLFLENGFTYFDTAYGYHGGKSEVAARYALVERHPRESFQLATKLPAWAGAANAEEAKAMLYTSLDRTQAGYFDFYLLHNLGGDRIKVFDDFGIWDFVQEQKAKGVLKHVGFSFHDSADLLDEVLTKHPEMEFVQLQINYADWDSASVQSRKCFETAKRHNKPVIIMEPVKGGSLANLPDSVAEIFKKAEPGASLSSWAVRYAASLPGIITVLSGMSNLEQMKDNLKTMKGFTGLNDDQLQVVAQAVKKLNELPRVPCTGCGYCTSGCPMGINIPGIFNAYNNLLVYGNRSGAKGNFGFATRNGGKPADCAGCGHCESVCPQHIDIMAQLSKANRELGE